MYYTVSKNGASVALALVFLSLSGVIFTARAEEYFNPDLLQVGVNGGAPKDLSSFESGGQLAGKYHVDIYVNDTHADTLEIEFAQADKETQNGKLIPCLHTEMLRAWGIKIEDEKQKAENSCFDLSSIDGLTTDFRFTEQRLNISVPQALITHQPQGYIDPSRWDDGINAFMLNYSLNGTKSLGQHGGIEDNQYINLHPGLNIAGWRYRNYSIWDSTSSGKWDSVYNYIAKDIKTLRSQLVLGDSNTPSSVFDSVAFRGVQLFSDDDMQPESQKGYAPVVSGIANTNAEVSVLQHGYTIYKTNVAPGAFEINDLYPTSGSGDLILLIKESDGTERRSVIPYASVPAQVREGAFKYQAVVGKTRFNSVGEDANFSQVSLIYGLPWDLTAYTGAQYAAGIYQSYLIGGAIDLGRIGAVSLDMTRAQTTFQHSSRPDAVGDSLRLRYNKNLNDFGTNIVISGYRYSTKGYYSLQEAVEKNGYDALNSMPSTGNMRSKTDFSLSQDIKYGFLSLSLSQRRLWNDNAYTSIGVSYSNAWNRVNYNINYTMNKQPGSDVSTDDRQLALNVNIPLDIFSHPGSVSYNLTSGQNNSYHNIMLSGSALKNESLNWSVQQGYDATDHAVSGNTSASWTGSSGKINAGYSYDEAGRSVNYGVDGGMLLTRQGLTFSQQLGETNALVIAPGAANIAVSGQTGILTDAHGLAVIPNVTPFRDTNLSFDTETINNEKIELIDTNKMVTPTRGAIVLARYQTSIGSKALINLVKKDGTPVPFGANVTLQNQPAPAPSGITGNNGQVYMTGLKETGTLLAQWGDTPDEQCIADYHLNEQNNDSIAIINLNCH